MPWSVYVIDSEAEISTFMGDFTDFGDAWKAQVNAIVDIVEEGVDGVYAEIRESK